MTPEADLIERASDGDVAAFGELYELHVERIHGLCLRMVREPARAEDLTQEVFVRAWRRLTTFRRRSAFYTWLHRLAVNVVLTALRADKRWPESLDPNEWRLESAETSGDASSFRPASRIHASMDLEKAIEALPPRPRMVFWLHDVEGYRHREIGELLGVAEGTSKVHLHRARLLLREALSR